MGPDGGRAHPRVIRQGQGHGRRLTALLPAPCQAGADGVGMRHPLGQGLRDGGIELGSAEAVEQTQQTGGEGAQVLPALGGGGQQLPAVGGGVGQPIGPPVGAAPPTAVGSMKTRAS